jgi:thymidylate kinase
MRDTRLIFVEGMPGAGKSTTGQLLTARLQAVGVETRYFPEFEAGHPLNVGGSLHPAGESTGAELFRQYTVETYVAESLDRWRSFVSGATDNGTVSILDSYPYQNAARVLLQLDAPMAVLQAYARDVEALARPLEPVLIFLERLMTPDALATTAGTRGEAWTAYAIEVMTSCPYAQRRNLTGPSGAVAMLGAYHGLVQDLMRRSELPRLMLEGCAEDWAACHARIDAFLEL